MQRQIPLSCTSYTLHSDSLSISKPSSLGIYLAHLSLALIPTHELLRLMGIFEHAPPFDVMGCHVVNFLLLLFRLIPMNSFPFLWCGMHPFDESEESERH